MGQPAVATDRAGFGPSPSMGQPAVPFGQPGAPAVRPAPAQPPTAPPLPARTVTPAKARPPEIVVPTEAAIAALLDEPEVVPWDRKPLLIVIATAIVLVLIGVAAAFVTAAVVGPARIASWRDHQPAAGAVPHGS
jgi:hypothetical protein